MIRRCRLKIVVDNERITIQSPNGRDCDSIRWDDVYSVSCYKVDAKSAVIRYMNFDYSWGDFVEVCDRMDGFDELAETIEKHLPNIRADWRSALKASGPKEPPILLFRRSTPPTV